MAKIKIWPHEEICPDGAQIESLPDETICEAALRNNIKIEHACEMSAACTTCHCIVRKGFESLEDASDIEEDLLDKACLLYTSPSPRDLLKSRMPSSA